MNWNSIQIQDTALYEAFCGSCMKYCQRIKRLCTRNKSFVCLEKAFVSVERNCPTDKGFARAHTVTRIDLQSKPELQVQVFSIHQPISSFSLLFLLMNNLFYYKY